MRSPRPVPALAGPRLIHRQRFATAILVALLAAAAALYGLVLAQAASNHQDLETYLAAARDLLNGRPLYDPFLHHSFPDPTLRPVYIYPPVFALGAAALAAIPPGAQPIAWLIATQAALGAALAVVLRAARPTMSGAILAAAATATFYPLWVDAVQGQANTLVLVLTVTGFVLVAQERDVGALAIGAAAALKLTPLIAVAWLAWERRWRAALLVVLSFAAVTGLGFLVRASDTLTYFRDVLPQLARGTAYYSNQSMAGVLARLFTANPYTDPWARLPFEPVISIVLGLCLLAFWAISMRRHDPLHRAMAFLPLLPLLSAVTWEHHLIVLLPLCWLLIIDLARRGLPVRQTAVMAVLLLGFDVLARWRPGPAPFSPGFRSAQTGDPLVLLTANSLFLATLALLLLSPWLLRAR